MSDTLKALPWLSAEDYLWGYSSAFIRLAAYDQSRVKYLSQKQIERRKAQRDRELNSVFTAGDVMAKLGISGTKKAEPVSNWRTMLQGKKKEEEPKNEIENGSR